MNKSTSLRNKYKREYKSWECMHSRCRNKNDTGYKYYGGRGIKIVKRWNSFENFLKDMGRRPEYHTLDRKNCYGNYSKRNCRWLHVMLQSRNQRKTDNYNRI